MSYDRGKDLWYTASMMNLSITSSSSSSDGVWNDEEERRNDEEEEGRKSKNVGNRCDKEVRNKQAEATALYQSRVNKYQPELETETSSKERKPYSFLSPSFSECRI